MEGFRGCFADLVDPRRGNAQRHELDEMVMVALLAMVSSAETCFDMALFGRSTDALLRRFLRLPGGIPSHDTSRGCFGCSIPRPSRCASHATWRHSPSGFRGWSRSTARQCATPATASKTKPPASDQRLRLRHAAGTRAALGRRRVQRDHRLARASGALDTGWLLPRGGKRFSSAAATMCSPSRATRRRSSRTSSCCSTIPMPCSTMWRRRSTAIMAGSRPAGARSSTTRSGSPNGTASLPPGLRLPPVHAPLGRALLDVVRAHWHVENRLHCVLDVVMDEDPGRKDHGPENLARLRRFALNILRANQDKGST
jgi:hypothetical protein